MKNKSCYECGYTLAEFYKTGMLGCPDCYNAFREELISAIKDVQNGAYEHCGDMPDDEDKWLLKKYKELLAEKEQAVIEERFDDSATLAEEISEIVSELEERGLI